MCASFSLKLEIGKLGSCFHLLSTQPRVQFTIYPAILKGVQKPELKGEKLHVAHFECPVQGKKFTVLREEFRSGLSVLLRLLLSFVNERENFGRRYLSQCLPFCSSQS